MGTEESDEEFLNDLNPVGKMLNHSFSKIIKVAPPDIMNAVETPPLSRGMVSELALVINKKVLDYQA